MGVYAAELRFYTDSPTPGYPSDTVFLSSAALVTGATDTPAHIAFQPRITQPALLRRDVFEGGVTGISRVAYGELVLANPDGALDWLLSAKVPGYGIIIRYGTPGTAYPSAWTTVFSGVSAGLTIGWRTLAVKLRDPHQTLTLPLQTATYGGTNSGGAGIDGTADDLKGQTKPLLYGRVLNVSPPCVNTSKLIYQINDGAVVVSAVYDKGVALTAGTAYASQADMEGTAPSAGGYRVWPAGGCFRLGSTPAGTITADAAQTSTAANHTAAKLLQAIALKAGVASGSISSSDVTALHAANSAELGLWLNSGETAQAAMDAVAVSVGAWYGFDAAGQLRMRQMTAPSGTPVMDLTRTVIIGTPELRAIGAASGGAFYTAVECRYAKNYTVQQESDLAGSVTAARRAWAREEWRTARPAITVTDPGYQPVLLYSFDALFLIESAANTEALRRHNLLYGRHDTLALTVASATALGAAVELGDVVRVTLPRFGYDAGALFRVIGMQYDLGRNRVDLTLWR